MIVTKRRGLVLFVEPSKFQSYMARLRLMFGPEMAVAMAHRGRIVSDSASTESSGSHQRELLSSHGSPGAPSVHRFLKNSRTESLPSTSFSYKTGHHYIMKTYSEHSSLALVSLALIALLAGCGGGSTDSQSSVSAPPSSSTPVMTPVATYSGIAGYYTYENSSTGESGQLIVAPDGTFIYSDSIPGCYTLVRGKFALASDNYTINASPAYTSPSNGCASPETLSLSGDFIAGSEIEMYGTTGTDLEWQYDAEVSTYDATLSLLKGSYQFSDGTTLIIDVNGNLSATNVSIPGCEITGTVSIPNAAVNIYVLDLNLSGCIGENASLNGSMATGLFALDQEDDQLVGGISVVVNGVTSVLFGSAELL
jgi:hypothetical protein